MHALVLGVLGMRAVQMDTWNGPSPPLVLIDIAPRPMLQGERPRERNYAAPQPTERTEADRDIAGPRPGRILREEEEDESADVAALPPGAANAQGEDAIDDAWRVPTSPSRRQVARSLRGSAIGCDMRNGRMSAQEQAWCDDDFGRAAAEAAPIEGSGNAARDARFAAQGRRNIESYEARRRPLAGGTGLVGQGDCPGSNFGTGCPGAHLDRGWRRDSNDEMSGAQGRYSR